MSIISFEITYKNIIDKEPLKLSIESDFQQLKILICGRYKFYDMNNIYIYYKGKIINPEEHTKLRNIFKKRKVQIEVKESMTGSSEDISRYYCQCNNPAIYICDLCNEYICNFCYSLKKHITHSNKIIQLSNYNNYIKISLRDNENLINSQIIKDDGYLFLEYLEYDINNEIKTINNMYDYAKNQLEEIKQMQINFILEFNKCNKYNDLSEKIDEVVSLYSNINMDDSDFDNLIEEKNNIIKKTKELLSYYDEIKMHLLYYTKNIKEIQNFNEGLIKEIKHNFSSTRKKFIQLPKIAFKPKNENMYNSVKRDKKVHSLFNTIDFNNDFSNTINSDYPINTEEKKENESTPKKEKKAVKKSNSTERKYKKGEKSSEIRKNIKVMNKEKTGSKYSKDFKDKKEYKESIDKMDKRENSKNRDKSREKREKSREKREKSKEKRENSKNKEKKENSKNINIKKENNKNIDIKRENSKNKEKRENSKNRDKKDNRNKKEKRDINTDKREKKEKKVKKENRNKRKSKDSIDNLDINREDNADNNRDIIDNNREDNIDNNKDNIDNRDNRDNIDNGEDIIDNRDNIEDNRNNIEDNKEDNIDRRESRNNNQNKDIKNEDINDIKENREKTPPEIIAEKRNSYKKKAPPKKKIIPDRVLIRIKDETKLLIFSIENLSFKERFFIDRANFAQDITNLNDIIQLNHNNILFMLMGKLGNKLFYYNYQVNSIYFSGITLYSHNYGAMIYCPKNNSIYLMGGNNQKNCELCEIKDLKNLSWNSLPQLNEERQEFGTLCFNEYIYVFFGFNSIKNKHCNSIERINVDENSQFETIYSNKEIKISSLGCCKLNFNPGTEEIMLLGGYDGEKFVDTTLIFMVNEMKIREGFIRIPNMDIHEQFLFYKEPGFNEFEPRLQFAFDLKNNVHLLSTESYELFTEGLV